LPLDVVDWYWLYEENMKTEYHSDCKWMLYYEKIFFNKKKWNFAICFLIKKLKSYISVIYYQ